MKWLGILLIVFMMVGIVSGFQIRPNDIVLSKNTRVDDLRERYERFVVRDTSYKLARAGGKGIECAKGN